MAKKKSSTRKKTTSRTRSTPAPDATGKHLVIVESPTKAKTINKYLGKDYVVMASVGHVRDLPSRAPKGTKQPVPGVDLEHDFEPTYEIMPDKKKTVADLKKAAKGAADIWFATDLDREGEAIAWHLAQALSVPVSQAKRVVFNAITQNEINQAFARPRAIDEAKVNAQQARRILDRIVGYQVSPLLWKKVAGGLSAGRVQSVAVRLVVEREREIEAFVPDEYWRITGLFSSDAALGQSLGEQYRVWLDQAPEDAARTQKDRLAWLSEHACVSAELVAIDGRSAEPKDLDSTLTLVRKLGMTVDESDITRTEDPKAKGPAQQLVTVRAKQDPTRDVAVRVSDIQTKRNSVRPPAPFITSTLQQTAANRLSFPLQRTMRIAQQLYEGVNLGGQLGQTGLITYMRTDSTHLSGEALQAARGYIDKTFGDAYLPEKPNFFSSSNRDAQEAHEAIRPTDVRINPRDIREKLSEEQFKLYDLIWRRFVACQMTPAQWDSTTVMISLKAADEPEAAFKATGRVLIFDGFYKVMGPPQANDVATLPKLDVDQPLGVMNVEPTQHFTSPPPRYSEASLQKKLEEEGIGRPSTYASIIQTIQDRKYVEQLGPRDRRMRATDLGCVVTDKLIEGFADIMDVSYTREMESELDKIEDEKHDWVQMLQAFYGPFSRSLEQAHEVMTHAKAQTEPSPYECEKCGAEMEYRFGKNGRFLSCSRYPDCKNAHPIDREGKPLKAEETDIICPDDGARLIRRTGRFGPFLSSPNYPDTKFILKLDPKTGGVVLPKIEPMTTDLLCSKDNAPLYLRDSKRGFWLSCSNFPKCRGREAWKNVDEAKQQELEAKWAEHVKAHPLPVIVDVDGRPVPEGYVPQITPVEDDAGPAIRSDADVSQASESDAA